MYRSVMPAERLLRWRDLHPLRAGLHVARSTYLPSTTAPQHGHDFAELCWIERGHVRHVCGSNGQILAAGDAVLIEPGHVHRLEGCPGGGTLVNIAFAAATLENLRQRWGLALWPRSQEPQRRHLDRTALIDLTRRCQELLLLAPHAGDALHADLLLGSALHALRPSATPPWRTAPAWLGQALTRLQQPPVLVEGLPALSRITGRSREHISRAIRLHCGCSPTALLQEFRLRWAERCLLHGDDAIASIGQACGFQGRAHFYRLFTARFGLAPAAYRRRARRTLER